MSALSIALRRFENPVGKPRGVLLNARTSQPSIAGSVFEASRSQRCLSPNTLYSELCAAQVLLSWAEDIGFDLERRLLEGLPLEAKDIGAFANWLTIHCGGGEKGLTAANINTFNAYLGGAKRMVSWFVDQYYDASNFNLPRGIVLDALHRSAERAWDGERIKNVSDLVAPDISDEDISTIETFLRNAASCENPEPRWVRTYLIWRLAIEFGLRIGEILALRLEDCPSRLDPCFRIVRIEDRQGPPDPRGIYAPRPKTLGRDLAPILSNSVFPRLVVDYQADHRLRRKRQGTGRSVRRPILSHSYLLVNDAGEPLSTFTARNFAQAIVENTGVSFTWHFARHAFFNRAYLAVAAIKDPTQRTTRMSDLVHWGGWRDPSSLDCYVCRARKERARIGLAIWNEANRWEALA